VVALALPFYAGDFWLQTGLFVMAAAVGAIGLTILTGNTGQLSLAHAFFLGVGAYTYCLYAGAPATGPADPVGLGLPPVVAAVLAAATAGLCGLVFSPVATRLRGIYLGVASLALVFLGQHLLFNVGSVTGGFYGRPVAPFEVLGLGVSRPEPELVVLAVPFGPRERLWYLFLAVLVAAAWFARNLLRARPGRAMRMVRDDELAAGVLGVPVRRWKAVAFVVSSAYAGLAGVLLALAFNRVVPEYFGLLLSIEYLAMVVIGGLPSVAGAVAGAAFVTAVPQLLTRYSGDLPVLAQPGSGGVDPAVAARFLYGAAVVAVVLAEPGGLAGLLARLRRRFASARWTPASAARGSADPPGDPPGGPPGGPPDPATAPAPTPAATVPPSGRDDRR
jgi:branched-chain amino acid transport system permease protein